jgi:3-methyl-2-oxobutanoate hydroxymethyltransferase
MIKKRVSVPDVRSRKNKEPLVALTAYTAPVARLLDPHVDILLVGDSVGMVIYGMNSTLGVTVDTMITHGRTVMQASSHACVVIDLPFASYQRSKEQAFENAARVMIETGAAAVKLEGGAEMAETIRFLTERGIPVMAHVGLMPQHVQALGGFKFQGKTEEEKRKILGDAKAVADAGAFCMVIEGTAPEVAEAITQAVSIPTIGIGASPLCDGQVLVIDDILGLSEYSPKFVKRYADLASVITEAAKQYAADVRARKFPDSAHVYKLAK